MAKYQLVVGTGERTGATSGVDNNDAANIDGTTTITTNYKGTALIAYEAEVGPVTLNADFTVPLTNGKVDLPAIPEYSGCDHCIRQIQYRYHRCCRTR